MKRRDRNWMRSTLVAHAAIGALMLASGCSPPAPAESNVVRPVKTMVVVAGGEPQLRTFPGRVQASRKVELAFQVPGLLVNFPVKEGQTVAKGDVIGQLRTDEFEARLKTLQGQLDQARAQLDRLLQGERPEERRRREADVRAAEARLVNARTEYQRLSRMLESQIASRVEFEAAETTYRVAKENLAAAMEVLEKAGIARAEDIEAQRAQVRGLEGRVVEANIQLNDCTLRAPYDGVIAQRMVEQNQNVQAKQPVVRLQDADEIDIVVDVPEAIMAGEIRSADITELTAEFTGAPGVRFPVRIREVAQVADPVTQTFAVRTAMLAPADFRILPGMTATVNVNYRRADVLGDRILVPITAVFKDPRGEQIAWVVGADQVVSRRPVRLGSAAGGSLEIMDGLAPGDRIAVAGVNQLREGMKVRDLGDALGGAQQ